MHLNTELTARARPHAFVILAAAFALGAGTLLTASRPSAMASSPVPDTEPAVAAATPRPTLDARVRVNGRWIRGSLGTLGNAH